MTKVTDADREAVVRLLQTQTGKVASALVRDTLAGERDDKPLVQQFARHREEATRELVEVLQDVSPYINKVHLSPAKLGALHKIKQRIEALITKHTGGE